MDEKELLKLAGRVEALVSYLINDVHTPSKKVILAMLGREMSGEMDD